MSKVIFNPADIALLCEPARSVVPAQGQIVVDDEVAAAVSENVFVVSDVEEPSAPEPDGEVAVAPQSEAGDTPAQPSQGA